MKSKREQFLSRAARMGKQKRDALAKLRKILGPKLDYREHPEALTGEDLIAARRHDANQADIAKHLSQLRLERMRALLDHDTEYKALTDRLRVATEAEATARGRVFYPRITVGIDSGFCFSVIAEADTWPEAVEKVEKAAK